MKPITIHQYTEVQERERDRLHRLIKAQQQVYRDAVRPLIEQLVRIDACTPQRIILIPEEGDGELVSTYHREFIDRLQNSEPPPREGALMVSIEAKRTPRELGAYNAGYRLGKRAWAKADPDVQDGNPPEELLDDIRGSMKRDGFWAGWNDAMVEG